VRLVPLTVPVGVGDEEKPGRCHSKPFSRAESQHRTVRGDEAERTRIAGREEIPADMMGLDIGPASTELFKGAIADARTIFWNGPMGVFEMTAFESGTREVALAVARNSRAVSVVGGGDSVAALRKFDLEDRVTFVSTGGGASMKLLEGARLPGVESLLDA